MPVETQRARGQRPAARQEKGFALSFDNELWEAGFTEVPNYFLQARNVSVEVRFACICILAHIRDRKTDVDEQQGTFIGLDTLAEKYGHSPRWWWQHTKELCERGILQRQPRGFGQTVRHKFVTDHERWNLDRRPSAWPNHLHSLPGGQAGAPSPESGSAPTSHASAKLASSQTHAKMDSFANACETSSQTHARRYSQTHANLIKDGEDTGIKKIQNEQDAVGSASGDAPPASAPKNGAKPKPRERACKTPQEEAERERLMQAFNDLLRPVDFTELGRCRNEMLRGLREHEYEGMEGCMRAMSTSKRFVGQSWVTPVTVVRNVLLWQDAGQPRQWGRVEEYAARKAQQQGGAGR